MNILSLNSGSSSLKFQLLEFSDRQTIRIAIKGMIERIGTPDAGMKLTVGHLQNAQINQLLTPSHAAEAILNAMATQTIDALTYRVVHGGDRFTGPTKVTPEVLDEIRSLRELAPLHNEAAIECMTAGLQLRPQTPGYAVFDTSFHRTMPEVASCYAIPKALSEANHLHRYGFHGISHRYVSEQLLRCMNRPRRGTKLITCHLGSGTSVSAIRDGLSIDTSMGLTPLEGLIMGTRSGDIDPGLVLHLIRVLKMSADDVDDLLNHQSGLKGLSGRSGDVRDLTTLARNGDARAEAALEAFAYRCRKYIGSYAAALGGVDAIAFAGGVGEHSSDMRERIVRNLEFMGIEINLPENDRAHGDVAANIGRGSVQLWIIPTDEERQMGIEVFDLLAEHPSAVV